MNARAHPYDLVFATDELEGTAFPAIKQEAEARAVDARDAERTLLLEGMGELMRSLLPADATAPAFSQFGSIVWHAYQYWLAGKQTFSIDEPTLRRLLAPETQVGEWRLAAPASAGYLQLPRNSIFSQVDEGAHAEAVDGFFFVYGDGRLDLLLVLGLVPNRSGFSVINVSGIVSAHDSEHWGDVTAREEGTDFENILPGGSGRLYAVTNALEVLKLATRVFWSL
ncbi:MAG: hypothetical protein ACT4O1_02685 [Gemmatimonadota bacterium]